MPVHALVVADRLLDVLLAAEALGLPRLHVVIDAAQVSAYRRQLGGEGRGRPGLVIVARKAGTPSPPAVQPIASKMLLLVETAFAKPGAKLFWLKIISTAPCVQAAPPLP